ncbi:MAG: type IX secretion system membrane protein PorP/SprF, partial [Elusimicrobiota bacterium]
MKRSIILGVCLTLCDLSLSAGSLQNDGFGARQVALGGAVTAAGAEGAYAVYYNPAQLASNPQTEITMDYAQLLMGLTDASKLFQHYYATSYRFKGAARPVRAIGAAYTEYALDDPELGKLFSENAIYLSYAQRLRPYLFGGRLSLGATLKSIRRSFGVPGSPTGGDVTYDNNGAAYAFIDPFFAKNGTTAKAMSFDTGIAWLTDDGVALGMRISDITEPDLAILPRSSIDKLSRGISMGAGYRRSVNTQLVASFESKRRLASVMDKRLSAGIEQVVPASDLGTFALRGSFGTGNRQWRQVAMGVSWKIFALSFDYAFEMPLGTINSTVGSHRLSFSARFGASSAQDDILKAYHKQRDESKELRRQLRNALTDLDWMLANTQSQRIRNREPLGEPAGDTVMLEPVQAHPDAIAQEKLRDDERAKESLRHERQQEFDKAWARYLERKSQTAPRSELLGILTQIQQTHGRQTVVDNEWEIQNAALAADSKRFEDLWSAYRRALAAGAPAAVCE